MLFRALDAGRSLSTVLGLAEPATRAAHRAEAGADAGTDSAELYGFAELQPAARDGAGRGPAAALCRPHHRVGRERSVLTRSPIPAGGVPGRDR